MIGICSRWLGNSHREFPYEFAVRNSSHVPNSVKIIYEHAISRRPKSNLSGHPAVTDFLQRSHIDTTSAAGKLIFGIFAALAEFEGALIRERTMAGLAAARARAEMVAASSN